MTIYGHDLPKMDASGRVFGAHWRFDRIGTLVSKTIGPSLLIHQRISGHPIFLIFPLSLL